jgi:regulator of cell morphogenesis and NO signaling
MFTPTTTLAEIASTAPALMQELERLGLDYCCGGKRSLAEACRELNLDPEVVIDELSVFRTPGEPAALPHLRELAAKVSRVRGEKHPELIRVAEVMAEIRADLEPHLRKEEEVLFPMIRSLASASSRPSVPCGSIANPIAVMEQEHVAVGGLLAEMRDLTHGYQAPADTCASTRALMAGLAELEADTHLHVYKENNHLFPAVMLLEKGLSEGWSG